MSCPKCDSNDSIILVGKLRECCNCGHRFIPIEKDVKISEEDKDAQAEGFVDDNERMDADLVEFGL